jgi:hypothetical protein
METCTAYIQLFLKAVDTLKGWVNWETNLSEIKYPNIRRATKDVQKWLMLLHGDDFTTALEIIKEEFPKNYNDVSGVQNY